MTIDYLWNGCQIYLQGSAIKVAPLKIVRKFWSLSMLHIFHEMCYISTYIHVDITYNFSIIFARSPLATTMHGYWPHQSN
jgi:hypothetical protein